MNGSKVPNYLAFSPILRARWVSAKSMPPEVVEVLTDALNAPKALSDLPRPVHIRGDLYAVDLCAKHNPSADFRTPAVLHSACVAIVRDHPKRGEMPEKLQKYYRRDVRLGSFRGRDLSGAMVGYHNARLKWLLALGEAT